MGLQALCDFLAEHPGEWFTVKELSEEIGCNMHGVNRIVKKNRDHRFFAVRHVKRHYVAWRQEIAHLDDHTVLWHGRKFKETAEGEVVPL